MNNEAAPTFTPLPETLLLQALPARLWLILGGLRAAIAAWGGRDPAAVPLVVLVYGRVGRIAQRFEGLVAHLLAGTLPPPRLRAGVRTAPRAAYVRLPGGSAWLVRRLQETVAFGSQLQAMLDDPAMAALLEACPRAARLIQPLRRMLGMTAPGAKMRVAKPAVAWWQAAPPQPAPEVTPCGQVLFPGGRPPPCWSG